MKPAKLSVLGVALAIAVAAVACNRADHAASEPATTASQPATDAATSPGTVAGSNTATTDTTNATPAPVGPVTTTTADATTSFDDMDLKDDSLSQDELSDTNPLRQGFTAADSDGNGTLSRSEVDAYRSRMSPAGG